ncbi:MAG: lytic transglycosylase domain-containing protein [Pseudomonadota bacterium]
MTHRPCLWLTRLVLCALALLNGADRAMGSAELCYHAGARAAAAHGIPAPVMHALTLTETGRRGPEGLAPWPWTVNMEGDGHWFATRADAIAFVTQRAASGARSYDVGCFQLNHRWHGDQFDSLDAMFGPDANADYAARYLIEQFDAQGSWEAAAGAYHSKTPHYAARYRDRFSDILADLSTRPAPTLKRGPQSPHFVTLYTPLAPGAAPPPPQSAGSAMPALSALGGPLVSAANAPLID